MTEIWFLRCFSLEQKEKFLNTSFRKKSLIPRGIVSKASIVPIETAQFLKELGQKPSSSLRKDKAYKQFPTKPGELKMQRQQNPRELEMNRKP